jgi:hypothetical protein
MASRCSCRASIRSGFEVDHGDPTVNQARVLSRADVVSRSTPAGKQPIVIATSAKREPTGHGLPRSICDLERDRPAGLLLDDGGALAQRATRSHVAHSEPDEVTATQLRVDPAIEQSEVSGTPDGFQLLTDRPHMLGFERWFGTDDAP